MYDLYFKYILELILSKKGDFSVYLFVFLIEISKFHYDSADLLDLKM